MYQTRDLERICRNLATEIEDELIRVGVFFRIFYRVKTGESIEKKIIHKGENYYNGETKFLRDIIGIRVIFYFSDDLSLIYEHLKNYFVLIEETIDKNDETKFAPTRGNLIFRIPESFVKEFTDVTANKIFDSTFEVQLRTILSEGWHEVDHDLRYKCIDDWQHSADLARNFNGILATLETSEYTILRLFEQLSNRHYKSKNLVALIRTKFRLRFANDSISEELIKLINNEIIREIHKLDRLEVIKCLFKSGIILPITVENLIFMLNYHFIKNKKILDVTPKELLNEMN